MKMLYTQQKIFNFDVIIIFIALMSVFWLPLIATRNIENSKSELHENSISTGSGNGKANSVSAYYAAKHNLRSLLMSPRDYQQKSRSKLPLNLDLMDFLLEYDDEDRSKRFDDYGHMRFGKRGGEEQFDDYGHMRFGRSA